MLAVRVEVEDAFDEVLAEHFWALLQQEVKQAVFTQAKAGKRSAQVWSYCGYLWLFRVNGPLWVGVCVLYV